MSRLSTALRAVVLAVALAAGSGLAVPLVSHDLRDVFELADRIAVMRGGRIVAARAAGELSHDELVGLILGALPAPAPPGAPRGSDS